MKPLFLKVTVLIFFTITISCINKDDPKDQLPSITQTGANTFGCVINGEVLIPKNGIGVPEPKGIQVYYFQNKNFVIDAANLKDNDGDRIYIYVHNLISTGTYQFGLSNGANTSTFEPSYPHCWIRTFNGSTGGIKYLSNTNSGTITITRFDPINHIVSGIFNLTVFNKNKPNETIEITNGRFDVNWVTL